MVIQQCCRNFVVAFLCVCLAAHYGSAAEVQGYVKDAGEMKGNDGLDAV
jgi:hypothetical protein